MKSCSSFGRHPISWRARVLFLLILLNVLACSFANATELEQRLQNLRRKADAISLSSPEQRNAVLRIVATLDFALKRGDLAEIRTAVENAMEQVAIPPEFGELLVKLNYDLPRLLSDYTKACLTEVDQIVERTRTECLAAKKREDLKPLLNDLSALKERMPKTQNSPVEKWTFRNLDAAITTTEGWMSYLAYKDGNGLRDAINALRGILANPINHPAVPRGEIEKLITELNTSMSGGGLSTILAKIKTLEDVELVAPEVASLSIPNAEYLTENGIRWFNNFRAATAAYLAGDIGNAWMHMSLLPPTEGSAWLSQAYRLRAMLAREVLPRYLKLPPGAERLPDETPSDHFRRLLAEAAAQERWEDLQRLASAEKNFLSLSSGTSWLLEIVSSVNDFLQGKRFEEAGNLPGAILAYQRVLRSTSDLAPLRQAGARLKTLRETQPKVFAELDAQIQSNRTLELIKQLEETLKQFSERLAKFEAERATQRVTRPPGAPLPPQPAASLSQNELRRLEESVAKIKADERVKYENIITRLQKLEKQLAPTE